MQASLLPLFPLPVVVFPRTQLPLHIFEDRYKEMVGEAIEAHSEFGIVLAKDDGILNVGCTVVVERMLKHYPDGRMDIVTTGVRRFELVLLNQDKSYLRGEVQYFDDDVETDPIPAATRDKALELYRQWLDLGEAKPFGEVLLGDPQLSFQLAQAIPDPDFLQGLLRDRSEASRLKQVMDFMSSYIPKQQLAAHMKKLSRTNGHGPEPGRA